jgi:single-strand DNA-binding protein
MLNTITICGRICNELELKTTTTGTEVLSFTVACDRDFKDSNGEKQADFIDVVAFKNTAVFVSKYFAKGRMAIVDGRLQTRMWEDKNGNKRKSVEVIADNVYFGDSKNAASNGNADESTESFEQPESFAELGNDEDLPF